MYDFSITLIEIIHEYPGNTHASNSFSKINLWQYFNCVTTDACFQNVLVDLYHVTVCIQCSCL